MLTLPRNLINTYGLLNASDGWNLVNNLDKRVRKLI